MPERESAISKSGEMWFDTPIENEFDLFEVMKGEDLDKASEAIGKFAKLIEDFPRAKEGLIEHLKDEVKLLWLENGAEHEEATRIYNAVQQSNFVNFLVLSELLRDEDIATNQRALSEITPVRKALETVILSEAEYAPTPQEETSTTEITEGLHQVQLEGAAEVQPSGAAANVDGAE